jgi:retron-type reverse transcriptase
MGNDLLLGLSEKVINSFEIGLPLGNLTSQLFINLYLHELDWYIKHTLHIKYYIRYADDIVILGNSPDALIQAMRNIEVFLKDELRLTTHKISIRSIYAGVDVVGEVFFPRYTTQRRSTARRAKMRLSR